MSRWLASIKMIFGGLPFLKKECTGDDASDAQHHEGTWYQYVLPSEDGLGRQVYKSIPLPIGRVVIICYDYCVISWLQILLNAPPHFFEIGQP